MRASVEALAADLARLGSPLTVVRGDPRVEVASFAASVGATRVLVSRDYTPYGRARDRAVSERLDVLGIGFDAAPGGLIVEPEDVTTAAGTPYRVYGPFRKSWLVAPRRAVLPAPSAIRAPTMPRRGADRSPGHTQMVDVLAPVAPTADTASLPEPGEPAARQRLDRWATGPALERYASHRDRLDLDGTSRRGADLRWGLLSPPRSRSAAPGKTTGAAKFLDELAWRDFYAHLLSHEPRASPVTHSAARSKTLRALVGPDAALPRGRPAGPATR